ncbi:hypothetical protein GJAV_G00211560 [Gymnothorax javanicus]|nr:hypothetical protein GJAV_G00211560 [Gymnothorax javanicus]
MEAVSGNQFWAKFIRNYLPSLQTRSKWQQERDDLTVGSIVMIVDPQLPRALWPVGNVSAVMPGADGRIRTVQIQLSPNQAPPPQYCINTVHLPKSLDLGRANKTHSCICCVLAAEELKDEGIAGDCQEKEDF